MTVYLRIGKRHTSWESLSPEEIVRAEFSSREGTEDLRPSVYAVGAESIVRVEAEHLVSQTSPQPTEGRTSIDLFALARFEQSEGATLFSLTTRAHGELIINDKAALLAMVAKAQSEIGRRHVTSRKEIYAYAASRLDAGDPEWRNALDQRPAWDQQLTKWRKRQSPPPS